MKRSKKILLSLLVIGTICLSIFAPIKIKADSGFDFDYDSGGGLDSGSDWDSGYDSSGFGDFYLLILNIAILQFAIHLKEVLQREKGKGRRETYSKILCDIFVLLYVFICIVPPLFFNAIIDYNSIHFNISFWYVVSSIITITYLVSYLRFRFNFKESTKNKDFSTMEKTNVDKLINKYFNSDKEVIYKKAYKIFVDVQNSWMNFHLDEVKEYLSDELYNMYVSQLDTLKLKYEKNIMTDFKLNDIDIIEITEKNDKLNINIKLVVTLKDYIIDENNRIIRGDLNHYLTTYILTFITSKNINNQTTCPNCHAPVHMNNTGKCEYCDSVIVNEKFDMILTKKQFVSKRRG